MALNNNELYLISYEKNLKHITLNILCYGPRLEEAWRYFNFLRPKFSQDRTALGKKSVWSEEVVRFPDFEHFYAIVMFSIPANMTYRWR